MLNPINPLQIDPSNGDSVMSMQASGKRHSSVECKKRKIHQTYPVKKKTKTHILERSNHEAAQSGLRFTDVVMHRQIHNHRIGPIKRLSGAQRGAGVRPQLTVVIHRSNFWGWDGLRYVEVYGNIWKYMEIDGNLYGWLEFYSGISGNIIDIGMAWPWNFIQSPNPWWPCNMCCCAHQIHQIIQYHSFNAVRCCKNDRDALRNKNRHRLSSVQNPVIPFWWVDRGSQTA